MRDVVAADFHALGLGEPLAIAASHGQGCLELLDDAARRARRRESAPAEDTAASASPSSAGPTSASRRWSIA